MKTGLVFIAAVYFAIGDMAHRKQPAPFDPYRFTGDPEFRALLIDVTLDEAKAYLARKIDREAERTWVEPMTELVLSKARQWPWAEWVREIVDDPETQEAFGKILAEMEP